MYLSLLKLDPDSRTTRELRLNPYLLHQAVFRAFPDEDSGGPGRVLYRMDMDREDQTNLLVQSEKKPDWDRAELLKGVVDEAIQSPKHFSPVLLSGQHLYFRLRANPTVKKKAEGTKNGYRLGLLREEDQIEWLSRKAEEGGFAVVRCRAIPEGVVRDERSTAGEKLSHYAVRFEGILNVVDPQHFLETIARGIGPAKGFGFGLLSIAPLREI